MPCIFLGWLHNPHMASRIMHRQGRVFTVLAGSLMRCDASPCIMHLRYVLQGPASSSRLASREDRGSPPLPDPSSDPDAPSFSGWPEARTFTEVIRDKGAATLQARRPSCSLLLGGAPGLQQP